jgi:hypothetical protein
MEAKLSNFLSFLGDPKKGTRERMEERLDFEKCRELIANMPEKALEKLRRFRDG